MADGSPPHVLSLVERALTPEHWGKWRKKLPPELRKLMPRDPPERFDTAREMARRILRRRRALIAAEDTPAWHVPYTAIAKSADRDRGTVAAWAADAPGLTVERGGVVIDGVTALEEAQARLEGVGTGADVLQAGRRGPRRAYLGGSGSRGWGGVSFHAADGVIVRCVPRRPRERQRSGSLNQGS